MSKLRISKELALPEDAVTQTLAILAKRGAGKTYTANVLAEEMVKAGLPICVLDPIGVWWGLRSSSDGKSDGLPVLILGGEHGDVPLESTAGAVIAEWVVATRAPVVLDLSLFSKGEQRRFVTDFAETLYRRNRQALHVFLDEADAFAPQRTQPGEQRMLGAIEDLVRRGRARGLGLTLITQRSAVLNKDVLTQVEVLVAMRMLGPHDRKAIEAWIEVHGTREERAEVLGSLAELPTGTAWVWAPSWLGILKKVQIRKRETFDSSATPKAGKKVIAPKLAPVDLAALREKIADTIERAEAEDPKKLRAEIARLKKELAKKAPGAKVETKTVERQVVVVPQIIDQHCEEARARIEAALSAFQAHGGSMPPLVAALRSIVAIETAASKARGRALPSPKLQLKPQADWPKPAPAKTNGAARPSGEVGGGGLRRMLIALAQRPQGLTNRQLGLRAGLSSKSGTFSTYVSRGRSEGWIDGRSPLVITDAGVAALGSYEPLPTGRALLEYWLGQLGQGGAGRMLAALAEAYPESMSNQELAEAADLSAASGTFSTYLSRLRTLELVDGRGSLRASEELFS